MPFDASILADIERNIECLDIDQIKDRLNHHTIGMALRVPIFDAGTFLYRGRKIDSSFNKSAPMPYSSLIYPPSHLARLGRLNRHQQSVFYCSSDKGAVFAEIQNLKPGDEIVLSFWKSTERMILNNVGYTEQVFRELGATRPLPEWQSTRGDIASGNVEQVPLTQFDPEDIASLIASDPNRLLLETLSKYFTRVSDGGGNAIYKITTAIGELHLGDIASHSLQFAGLIYPSVRLWGNADNMALQPWFVDKHLQFRKAVHCQITEISDERVSIRTLDHANAFDADGNLVWKGRMPVWQLGPGKQARMTLEAGVDADGDYVISAEGIPSHWTVVDVGTGLPLEHT